LFIFSQVVGLRISLSADFFSSSSLCALFLILFDLTHFGSPLPLHHNNGEKETHQRMGPMVKIYKIIFNGAHNPRSGGACSEEKLSPFKKRKTASLQNKPSIPRRLILYCIEPTC